jgi:protein tyrosine/serine phosphatase
MEASIGRKMDEASIRAYLEVHEDYLERFHETVRAKSGSLDAWLADVIGVDDALRERLRAKYIV